MTETVAAATQPSLPQPDAEGAVNPSDPAVQSAVNFLKDSRTRFTPAESKIRFLKQKGLSATQIKYAFEQAGQNVPLEKIVQVKASLDKPVSPSALQTNAGSLATSAAPTSPSLTAPATQRLVGGGMPTRTHTLYPATPYTPEPTPQPSWDWRDVVIGAGATALAAVGGVKLFQWYSPYEIRRKDDPRAIPRQPQRRRYASHAMSSDTEGDRGFAHGVASARSPGDGTAFGAAGSPVRQPPPPLPPAPVPAPTNATSAAAPPAAADTDSEVKRLEKELADAKEALVNERKRNAEISLSVAKVRNEKQQLIHKNDKLSQRVEDLEEQVKKLEEAAKEKEEKDTAEDGVGDEEAADDTEAVAAAAEGHDGMEGDTEDADNSVVKETDDKPQQGEGDGSVGEAAAAAAAAPADIVGSDEKAGAASTPEDSKDTTEKAGEEATEAAS